MRGEGAPRARVGPVTAGSYTCSAAGKPAATAKAGAAASQAGVAAAAGKAVTEARWLAVGTADPHGVGCVDRVRPGCEPALRLGSQTVATGAELMQSLLPEANVPPDTAPREPPEQLGGAPTVTAVEQVIPVPTCW